MPLAEKVVGWVRRKRVEAFTRTELHVALRGHVKRPEDWADPLRLLGQFNWVRFQDQEYAGRGRKPTPRYEVNPAAFDCAAARNQSANKELFGAINPPGGAGPGVDCADQ